MLVLYETKAGDIFIDKDDVSVIIDKPYFTDNMKFIQCEILLKTGHKITFNLTAKEFWKELNS